MKVLVVGSGGREHSLCWAIAASPLCDALYCAPGNAGIAQEAECVPIDADNIDALVAFAIDNAIDFVVVGPEAPLVLGLVDRLDAVGVKSFGPSAKASILEASKGFMKDLCAKYDIPTADYRRFTKADDAKAWVRDKGAPIVVKADGLAAGKGVTVAATIDEALFAIDEAMTSGKFGDAGDSLVIEEYLQGEEASFFALCDGDTALPLISAQDHKPVFDGDKGPNTGGMGAYAPAPIMTESLATIVMDRIIMPTINGMKAEGRPYKGVLYAGLMITADGPKLIEHNVRFGDPECQVLMALLKSDILPALIAAHDGVLKSFDLRWRDETAISVVMASNGYPGSYQKGTPINNLDAAETDDDVIVFHAGTSRDAQGQLIATGGRVLNVTSFGDSVLDARTKAYKAIDQIDWPEGFCRRDIGWRAIARKLGDA